VITGSIVLALVAAVFLGLGLLASSDPDVYFYCSIVGSVLAGFALFVGLRYRLVAQLPDDDFDGPRPGDRSQALPAPRPTPGSAPRPVGRVPGRATGRASVAAVLVAHGASDGWEEREASGDWEHSAERTRSDWDEGAAVATRWPDDDTATGLPDEPDEQKVSNALAAQVARLGADVAVIDGRPRYHLAECLHLLGRDVQRLPVIEVIELGFTPCGDCEPATALLLLSGDRFS
jgi:hypothetical protein